MDGVAPTPVLVHISPKRFRRVLRCIPSTVAVVAALVDHEPIGMLISSFTSISVDPPLVGFFAKQTSGTLAHLLRSPALTFSVLTQDAHTVCDAFRLPRDEHFNAVDWYPSDIGNPVIARSMAVLEGPVDRVVSVGDHELIVIQVERIGQPIQRRPLLYHERLLCRLDPTAAGTTHLTHLEWVL